MFLRYYYRMVTFYNITLSTAFSLLMLSVAEAARPNVVLINADDLGWAEVGCYGQKKIKTPNIDKLASEGQRWVYFYSGAPVCSPSRNVLMTEEGREAWAWLHGNAALLGLDPARITVAGSDAGGLMALHVALPDHPARWSLFRKKAPLPPGPAAVALFRGVCDLTAQSAFKLGVVMLGVTPSMIW